MTFGWAEPLPHCSRPLFHHLTLTKHPPRPSTEHVVHQHDRLIYYEPESLPRSLCLGLDGCCFFFSPSLVTSFFYVYLQNNLHLSPLLTWPLESIFFPHVFGRISSKLGSWIICEVNKIPIKRPITGMSRCAVTCWSAGNCRNYIAKSLNKLGTIGEMADQAWINHSLFSPKNLSQHCQPWNPVLPWKLHCILFFSENLSFFHFFKHGRKESICCVNLTKSGLYVLYHDEHIC